MLKIAFCDDDIAVLAQLRDLLEQYRVERAQELDCAAFHSPLDLLAEIERGVRYDILLLDVVMPGENGIDAAAEIRRYDENVKIIFLTSSSEYAVQSYGVSNDGTDMSDEQLAAITAAYNQVAPIYNEVYVNAENNGWMEDETTVAEINAVSAILGTIGEALTTDLSLLEGGDYDAMPGVMLELEEPLQELLERVSEPYDVG